MPKYAKVWHRCKSVKYYVPEREDSWKAPQEYRERTDNAMESIHNVLEN